METRCFAPGSLMSNLDFLESIFGNAGDPSLPENDAALDVMHWTGHTGCIILAPHLTGLKKKDLGLPHVEPSQPNANAAKACAGHDEDELYNSGRAFKITCRDERGVIVTILADNYYGYCKKEVKTQISFAANLFGLCEEEHAGGAIAYPAYILGQDFYADRTVSLKKAHFEDAAEDPGRYGGRPRSEGLRGRPALSEYLLCSRKRGVPCRRRRRRMAARRRSGVAD